MTAEQIDIHDVNFNDVDDALGFANLLLSLANKEGFFMSASARQSKAAQRITELAKQWVRSVNAQLPKMTPAESIELITSFDLLYIVAYPEKADETTFNKRLLDIFTARIRGDHSIDEYSLYFAIKTEINRRNKAFFGKPLEWEAYTIGTWRKNINNNIERPIYDTLAQASILLGEDLSAFEMNQSAYKEKIFQKHRHFLDEYADMDLKTLHTLSKFLCNSYQFIDTDDYDYYTAIINHAIINHPDINPYYRESFLIQHTPTYPIGISL